MTAYSDAVLADSPVLYLPLQESVTSTATYSAYTTQVPAETAVNVGSNTFSADFTFAVAGRISALRFYRSPSSPTSSRTMRVWSGSTIVATGTTSGESGAGWHTATLSPGVAVAAGSTLRISYDNPTSYAVRTSPGVASVTNGPVTRGLMWYGTPSGGYPNTTMPNDYFMDVVFEVSTAADVSGNNRHAVYMGGVANDATDAATPGVLGRHVRLDGTDDYIDLLGGSWFTPAANGFTFEGWFYTRSWSNWMRIFDFSTAPSTDDMFLAANNASRMNLLTNGTSTTLDRWTVNSWHHVVVTVSAVGNALVYLDGTPIHSSGLNVPTNTTRNYMYLGRSQYPGDPYLQASMCHIAVYNSTLSPTRVAAHYAAGGFLSPRMRIVEDFEDTSYRWALSGTWDRSTTKAYSGSYSLASADIPDYGVTSVDFTVVVPTEATSPVLELRRWVESEGGYDFFRVIVNSSELYSLSGVWPEWGLVVVPLTVGTNAITLRYTKDSVSIGGADKVWVDELAVSYSVGQAVVGQESTRALTVPDSSTGYVHQALLRALTVHQEAPEAGRIYQESLRALTTSAPGDAFLQPPTAPLQLRPLLPDTPQNIARTAPASPLKIVPVVPFVPITLIGMGNSAGGTTGAVELDNTAPVPRSLTLPIPTGLPVGALMIAHIYYRGPANALVVPFGWTVAVGPLTGGLSNMVVCTKLYEASDSLNYGWAFGDEGATWAAGGRILAFTPGAIIAKAFSWVSTTASVTTVPTAPVGIGKPGGAAVVLVNTNPSTSFSVSGMNEVTDMLRFAQYWQPRPAVGIFDPSDMSVTNTGGAGYVCTTLALSYGPPPAIDVYAKAVIADNPTGYWRLDEATGAYAATWGAPDPATIVGNPTHVAPGINSPRCAAFPSVNDYVQFGNAGTLPISTMRNMFSWECWFKVPALTTSSTGQSTYQIFGTNANVDGHSNMSWDFMMDYVPATPGRVSASVCTGGSGTRSFAYSVGRLDDNQWHHIVGTFDGLNVRLYVDGMLHATTVRSGVANAGGKAPVIGLHHVYSTNPATYPANAFPGVIDEPAFYDTTVLSPVRVTAHWDAAMGIQRPLSAPMRLSGVVGAPGVEVQTSGASAILPVAPTLGIFATATIPSAPLVIKPVVPLFPAAPRPSAVKLKLTPGGLLKVTLNAPTGAVTLLGAAPGKVGKKPFAGFGMRP
jgi:Concanavalin A-like lectin/glucanases superfamily/Domain of unknown function (DUF4082)